MTENEKIIEEANEIAKGRMYATNEVIRLQKELEQYRTIGTVEGYERAIASSIENYNLYREYKAKVQEFEAIGTIEEFKALKDIKQIADNLSEMERIEYKALKEKNTPKKPRWHGHHFCPNCNSIVYVNGGKDIYCPKCGQKLDWGEV